MPYIKTVSVAGLAGRQDTFRASLDQHTAVFYGLNGTGKTSLLRILHSAMLNNSKLLSSVPFTSAEVVLYSYSHELDYRYSIAAPISDPQAAASLLERGIVSAQSDTKWQVVPPYDNPWYHRYLPTWRIYTPAPSTSSDAYSRYLLGSWSADASEDSLESRFAENLTRIWKDYSAEVATRVNEAQEKGLASILRSVMSNSTSELANAVGNPKQSYVAVTSFLERRGMRDIALSEEEFGRRYRDDLQLRNVVEDIETVEEEIKVITTPRDSFVALINEMFVRDKSVKVTEKELEVALRDKTIGLNTLSSGEKHLLTMFVETLLTGDKTVILIDEPELSLHVDWQRKLIRSMRTLNPSAQLVLATHSPEIVADLPNHLLHEL